MSAPQVQNPVRNLVRSDEFKQAIIKRSVSTDAAIKFVSMFETAITKVPKLLDCTPKSIALAAYQLAELSLSPLPQMGHAYLIPYFNKTGNECQLQLSWRGLCTLAIRDGAAKFVHSNVVFRGDEFKVTLGLSPDIKHEMNLDTERTDAEMIAVYAYAELEDGSKLFEVMTRAQVDAFKKQYFKPSKSGALSPWDTAYLEMARKTVVKRLTKYLQLSEKTATQLDNEFKAEEKIIGSNEDAPAQSKLLAKMQSNAAEQVIDPIPTLEELIESLTGEAKIDLNKIKAFCHQTQALPMEYFTEIANSYELSDLAKLDDKELSKVVVDLIEIMKAPVLAEGAE